MNRKLLVIALGTALGTPLWAVAQGQKSLPEAEFFAFETDTEQVPVLGEETRVPLSAPSARQVPMTSEQTTVPVLPDVQLSRGQLGWFEALDLDNSGYITRFEAEAAAPSDEFNRDVWERLNANRDRGVDVTEFSAFEVEPMPSRPPKGLVTRGEEGAPVPTIR